LLRCIPSQEKCGYIHAHSLLHASNIGDYGFLVIRNGETYIWIPNTTIITS
jgi:hypothetical protein